MFGLPVSPMVHTFAAACSKSAFLGVLKPWYQYLTLQTHTVKNPDGSTLTTCDIANFSPLDSHSGILLIALAILDDLIRIAALVAVGYVIYGGIQFMTSQGSPDATSKARQTIINALIGLVLAILASSIVAFIGGRLGS